MEIRLAKEKDLRGINRLNQINLKENIKDEAIISSQGYVSWDYSMTLLQKLHVYHPSIVAKVKDQVIGYALILLKEARRDHPEFDLVLTKIDTIIYEQRPLESYNYYAMGQVCIDESYRGQGVFRQLFDMHKKNMQEKYDFVITTIAINNPRSIQAHKKIGFKTIHEFDDHFGKWIVVLWDWN